MRAQTSPLLTLLAVVIGGGIILLILCAGIFLLVNPFRASVTATPASGQRATVIVTQVVVITTTPVPTAHSSATNPPTTKVPPTLTPLLAATPIPHSPTPIVETVVVVVTATPLPNDDHPTPLPTSSTGEIPISLTETTESGGTGLHVNVMRADGSPARDVYIEVRTQKPDLSGNPVTDETVAYGNTDNTGTRFFELPPAAYFVRISVTGYPYGPQFNHIVESGSTRVLNVALGQILVGVLDADGKAREGNYVEIYTQKADLSGNPVTDETAAYGNTDNTGAVQFNLTAGDYRVRITGIAGEPYGDEFNHRVIGSQFTKIIVRLGRLTVGLKDAEGKPLGGRYVEVYRQLRDVAGNITRGDSVAYGNTENTGLLNLDLTPGNYIVRVNDVGTLMDVPIESGRTTFTDGTGFELR